MKRILIIEDDRDNASALGIRLRNTGYEVAVAYDAVSGFGTATRFLPDLVLLDVSMPGGGGMLVAERLRNVVSTAVTPIVFVTGTRDPDLRAKAAALGAAAFVEKPYDPRQLLATIGRLLGVPGRAPAVPAARPRTGCASEARPPRARGRAPRE
jgi:DNA-binding response OmpR family regulator